MFLLLDTQHTKYMKKNIHLCNKKIIVTLFLVINLTQCKPAHAILGAGDIVFDIPNTIEGTISAIFEGMSTATAIMQKINLVMGPIADAARVVQLVKSGNYIRNLVLGSVGGSNSLIVSNPQKYIQEKGKGAIREQLDNVSKANGLYSDKITASVVASARNKGDAKAKITAVTKSSIPKITQDSLCNDDKLTKITELAGDDDPQNPEDYATRKEELFDKLCSGDPDTDPELASTLTQISNSNPSWDTFMAKVSGDNSFTKTIQAQQIVDEEQQAKENAAEMDRLIGKGVVSDTECVGGTVTDQNGYSYCPTGKEVITKLSNQLSDALGKAIDAPNKLLSDSYGSNGIFVLLANFSSLLAVTNTTMNAFSAAVNGSADRKTVSTSTGQITYSTSTYTHTLTPGSGMAVSITTNVIASLNDDKTSLATLQKVDGEYSQLVDDYLSKVSTTKGCYTSLIAEFPEETIPPRQIHFAAISTNSDVIAALAYLNPELSATQAIKTKINADLAGMATMQTLITTTIDKIKKSDSIEEITDLQDAYTTTAKMQNLPTSQTAIDRVQEKGQFQQKVDGGNSKSEAIKKLDDLTAKCKTIGDTERAARDAARSPN